MKSKKQGLFVCTLAALVISLGWMSLVRAQPQASRSNQSLPDLAAGLLQVKGCLGVEAARTSSGKEVIFAWFEDKQAATSWYWSEMHKGVILSFFPGRQLSEPMKDVPENVGPILAIASITYTNEPKVPEVTLSISQIAIELYTPLSGGFALGGRFAPEKLKVPKRRIIVDDDDDE